LKQKLLDFAMWMLKQEIDALIAGCAKRTTTLLQLIKETAFRFGEAFSLRWCDVDVEYKNVRLNNPEKGSLPRMPRVSDKLLGMIMSLPRRDERVFGRSEATIRNNLRSRENELQINFKTQESFKFISTLYAIGKPL